MKMNRHFCVQDIRAAGILLINTNGKVLVRREEKKTSDDETYCVFSDPGGKVDKADRTPRSTAIRKAYEETDGILDKRYLKNLFSRCRTRVMYLKKAKYIFHCVRLSPKDSERIYEKF